MIDIIIPAYNAHKTIEQTLCSIAYQYIADKLNVYIVNDDSDKDYNEFVNFFSNFITIKELKLEKNSGPGVARQYGIDNSKSDYIIFMDSDDCFADIFSAKILYDAITENDYDVVIGSIAEETDDGFIIHDGSEVWLHGKIYKREYLKNNDIRFTDTYYDEDNAFNSLLFLGNPKKKIIYDKIYLWRKNYTSLTNKNNGQDKINAFTDYIENITWSLEKAIERNYDYHKIAKLAYYALLFIYYSYLIYYQLPVGEKLIAKSKKLKKITEEYKLNEEEQLEAMKIEFEIVYRTNDNRYLLNPFTSFDNFLNMIDEAGEE